MYVRINLDNTMKKRAHTILSWILAISLVWLPLSVSADISLFSPEKNNCHEMNAVVSGHATALNNSMHESMMQKDCCDHCDNNCVACTGMTSCGHNSNHASPFVLFNQFSSQPQYLAQSLIEQFVQYHNQIITPDIRPPVV